MSEIRSFEAATPFRSLPYTQVISPLTNAQVGLTSGTPADLLAIPRTGNASENVVLIRDCDNDGSYSRQDLDDSTRLLRQLAQSPRPSGDAFGPRGVTAGELLQQGFHAATWVTNPSCNGTLTLCLDQVDPPTAGPSSTWASTRRWPDWSRPGTASTASTPWWRGTTRAAAVAVKRRPGSVGFGYPPSV